MSRRCGAADEPVLAAQGKGELLYWGEGERGRGRGVEAENSLGSPSPGHLCNCAAYSTGP